MNIRHKIELKRMLEGAYVTPFPDLPCWLKMNFSPKGTLSVQIVSPAFKGLSHDLRQQHLQDNLPPEYKRKLGFISLYDLEEALEYEIECGSDSKEAVTTWCSLSSIVANPQDLLPTKQLNNKKIETAVFYSFKGVASFSALAMATASVLASRGHKVVVIDLDLEGLGDGIEGEPGLVDYFYDRAYGLAGTYQTNISDIVKEIPVSGSTGKLFSTPKGATTLDYISKVDDLNAKVVTDEGKTLWQFLFDDLKGYLDPDLVLVSSPSGLNKWAAVAVLEAASKVLVPEADRSAPQVLLDMMASAGVPGPIWFPLPVTRHSTIADLICIQRKAGGKDER